MTTSSRDAMWLLFILIIIGVIWSAQKEGGTFGIFPGSGPKLSPSGISENNETVRTSDERQRTIRETTATTSISISASEAQNTDPQKEYITIKNTGTQNINLGGGAIKNKNGIVAKIKNQQNGNPIILIPEDKALILTGNNTMGENFKINKCSGYFNQFHQFAPSISTKCPSIKDLPESKNLDDACLEYLPKIKSCQMPTSLPTNLSANCQAFIQKHSSYQGCVTDHQNDKDFDKKEWRIFLGRTTEFWAKRNEIIQFVDSVGKIIGEKSY